MTGNGDSKLFVLDTNVLLHNPNALFMFKNNQVIIPFDVIEELDKFKAGTGKTLLAIAAGMVKTLNEQVYEKLLCARPIMP